MFECVCKTEDKLGYSRDERERLSSVENSLFDEKFSSRVSSRFSDDLSGNNWNVFAVCLCWTRRKIKSSQGSEFTADRIEFAAKMCSTELIRPQIFHLSRDNETRHTLENEHINRIKIFRQLCDFHARDKVGSENHRRCSFPMFSRNYRFRWAKPTVNKPPTK